MIASVTFSWEEGRHLLHERFGAQVLAYVEAVSDDKSLPKAERKRKGSRLFHQGGKPYTKGRGGKSSSGSRWPETG